MNEWISVEDRLPDEQGDYIVYKSGIVCVDNFTGYMPDKVTPRWGYVCPTFALQITHWMPLPPPPKGE